MATIQFFINPIFSHIRPNLPLIDELIKNGDKVIFYSLSKYENMLTNKSVEYHEYQQYGDMFNWGLEKQCKSFSERYEYLIQIYGRNFSSDFINLKTWVCKEIERAKPDIVIYDYFDAYWAKQAAELNNVPAVSTVCTFAITSNFFEIAPEECLKYVLRIEDPELLANPIKAKSLLRILSVQVGKIFNGPPFPILEYGNSNKLNIVHTSEVFHPYSEAFDDTFVFCGYPVTAETTAFDMTFLDALSNKTVIYISLGSTEELSNACDFYRKCIEAFAQSDWQIIMTTGSILKEEEIGNIPSNFTIKDFVPQREILKHTDLFLTHCGLNSAQEALANGVPMCLLPWQADQFIVAHRLEQLGAGIRLNPRQCTAQDLKEVACRILANPCYLDASESVGNSLNKPDILSKIVLKLHKIIETD